MAALPDLSPHFRVPVRRHRPGLFVLILVLVWCLPGPVPAQVLLYPASTADPAEIATVYGTRSPTVGEDVNYRVRLTHTSTSPVEYYWDFGDGTLAEGNNAVHHYRQPGRYQITVSIRNRYGHDAETLHVLVTPRPASENPDEKEASDAPPTTTQPTAATRDLLRQAPPTTAAAGPTRLYGGAMQWNEGGYTWRVRSYFDYASAEQEARQHRRAGYRVGIIRDESGPGSTVFRVVLGQFSSVEAALRAKSALPYPEGVLLIDLVGITPEATGAPTSRQD